uniref:Uncharacterized protein n=1 Tax=Candidatus Kentrum sp. UNK TaxID=2126344 RepID=A0A450ZYR0_9GAMM|nr:MAG: hypothetical protein BECKUNK1418G_GA0071005_100543 [Candidatus Kentron sp. UNK]VFK68624.1 MAG: hypothetical protein BECKUNK1418H_GA0071006_100443 [Candidatus Kentron sp. UNK]
MSGLIRSIFGGPKTPKPSTAPTADEINDEAEKRAKEKKERLARRRGAGIGGTLLTYGAGLTGAPNKKTKQLMGEG